MCFLHMNPYFDLRIPVGRKGDRKPDCVQACMNAHLLPLSNKIISSREHGQSPARQFMFYCKLQAIIVRRVVVIPPGSPNLSPHPQAHVMSTRLRQGLFRHTLSRRNSLLPLPPTAHYCHPSPTSSSDDPPGYPPPKKDCFLVAQCDG